MTAILAAFIPDLWPYIIGGAAILAAWWGRYALGKRAGREAERQQTAIEAAERHDKAMRKGQTADAKARADLRAGDTPEDILRRNDGEWRK